ncbi:MAG: LysR family transcriptional regulator [Proteobacteria bacterium]|nr:LysR family transcriptional regulator [Pseudomonadota bacterium]
MIKVNLQYEWTPAPGRAHALDAMLFRLLHEIAASGSLAEAARRLGVSYRHAWGQVGKWGQVFGRPVVDLRQGRGASLTEFGRKLLWSEELVQARISHELEKVRREIEQALAGESGEPRLVLAASHDLALAELRDRLAQRGGLKLDLRFGGSLESLCALSKGQCALAGFHLAEGLDDAGAAAFHRHLKDRVHTLIGVATRTQGLMVARGNPERIRSLADLTRKGVRIVNRQRGSGSRVEFDQLLSGAGIPAEAIDGYLSEEFTHLAVAATVAGGRADAGYGIRAAASAYGLEFIPLLTERYYLACRTGLLADPAIVEFVGLLNSPEFRRILAALPGYGSAITGRSYAVREALRGAHCISKAVRSSSKKVLAKRATAL